MVPKIVPVVEGDGEVDAVPKLLWKLLSHRQRWDIQVTQARNAHGCENLKKPGGLERFIELAWREPDCAAVLVLMDADKDCPRTVAEGFVKRINAMGARRAVAVVIAKTEYEAWFLASLESIVSSGKTALPEGLVYPHDIESHGDVKG